MISDVLRDARIDIERKYLQERLYWDVYCSDDSLLGWIESVLDQMNSLRAHLDGKEAEHTKFWRERGIDHSALVDTTIRQLTED